MMESSSRTSHDDRLRMSRGAHRRQPEVTRERESNKESIQGLRQQLQELTQQFHQVKLSKDSKTQELRKEVARLVEESRVKQTRIEALEATSATQHDENERLKEQVEELRRANRELNAINFENAKQSSAQQSRYNSLAGDHKRLVRAKEPAEKRTAEQEQLVRQARRIAVMRLLEKPSCDAPMQIFVKTLAGRTIVIDVKPTDKVKVAKAKILEKGGALVERHQLMYGGKPLQDGRTFLDYGITKESTLTV